MAWTESIGSNLGERVGMGGEAGSKQSMAKRNLNLKEVLTPFSRRFAILMLQCGILASGTLY